MRSTILRPGREVTPRVSPSLAVPTIEVPDYDAVCSAARASADRFLGRECEQIARFSGLSVHAIRSLRDAREDQIPSVGKIALATFGGRQIGRSCAQVADFLAPIFEAAGGDFAPRLPIVGVIGVQSASAASLREASEAIAAALDATKDNAITRREADEIGRQCDEAITELHRLKREAEAAVNA